jgi:hypothetical protein
LAEKKGKNTPIKTNFLFYQEIQKPNIKNGSQLSPRAPARRSAGIIARHRNSIVYVETSGFTSAGGGGLNA